MKDEKLTNIIKLTSSKLYKTQSNSNTLDMSIELKCIAPPLFESVKPSDIVSVFFIMDLWIAQEREIFFCINTYKYLCKYLYNG